MQQIMGLILVGNVSLEFLQRNVYQLFPEPTHSKKHNIRCLVAFRWKEVKEVLDFNDEGKSIFDRPCPLPLIPLTGIKLV